MRFERSFHASDLRAYLTCPRAFFLREFMAAPAEKRTVKMVHGAALHGALKRFHSESAVNSLTLYMDALEWEERHSKDADVPVAWENRGAEIAELAADARDMLDNYRAKSANQECTILLSETEFEVEIAGYQFEGRIDQLRQNGNTGLTVLDYKTGPQAPNQQFLDLDYQLGIYAYAVARGTFGVDGDRKSFNAAPDRVVWYAVHDHLPYKKSGKTKSGRTYVAGEERGPAVYETRRTESDFAALERDVKRVCGSIRMGLFPRNPSQITCAMCRWWDACRADRDEGSLTYREKSRLAAVLAEEDDE